MAPIEVLTVGDALCWIRKLKLLESEGAQVIHLQGLMRKGAANERRDCATLARTMIGARPREIAEEILERGEK